jgi:hypothetical protein
MGTFQSAASLARVFGPAIAGAAYALFEAGPFLLAGVFVAIAWMLALGLSNRPVESVAVR